MANNHGGPRTPNNPAPVSGPGAMSRRTDGGPQQVQAQMTGMPYGENADFMDIQSAAPMAAAPAAQRARREVTGGSAKPVGVTPLFAPTSRPNEPVTAGAPFGPGDSTGAAPAAPVNPAAPTLRDTVTKLYASTNDPRLARIITVAEKYGW